MKKDETEAGHEEKIQRTLSLLLERVLKWLTKDCPKRMTMAQALQALEVAARLEEIRNRAPESSSRLTGNPETVAAELLAAVKKVYGDRNEH